MLLGVFADDVYMAFVVDYWKLQGQAWKAMPRKSTRSMDLKVLRFLSRGCVTEHGPHIPQTAMLASNVGLATPSFTYRSTRYN